MPRMPKTIKAKLRKPRVSKEAEKLLQICETLTPAQQKAVLAVARNPVLLPVIGKWVDSDRKVTTQRSTIEGLKKEIESLVEKNSEITRTQNQWREEVWVKRSAEYADRMRRLELQTGHG